ncbi:MAG: hypothetical protein ABIO86_02210 [Sphingomonas sp.]
MRTARVYDLRRHMRSLGDALDAVAPLDERQAMAERLAAHPTK